MDDFRKSKRRFFEGFGDDIFDDDMFAGFDEEFRRMQEHMGHIFDEVIRHQNHEDVKKYVYGFSMHTGPDGKPIIEEFGNVPKPGVQHIPGEREPLVDVIDGKEEVTVIAELPGVDKDDISLDADDRTLIINVDKHTRRYYKELDMPAEIDPDTIKAAYKNGILEVKIKRKHTKKQTKKKITVD